MKEIKTSKNHGTSKFHGTYIPRIQKQKHKLKNKVSVSAKLYLLIAKSPKDI